MKHCLHACPKNDNVILIVLSHPLAPADDKSISTTPALVHEKENLLRDSLCAPARRCAMTDLSAISTKGRIIAFPAATQQEKVPAVTTTAASTVTVTTMNTESAFYRVKLDTGDEVALLTRRNPPKDSESAQNFVLDRRR
jgi:hypothetical protein